MNYVGIVKLSLNYDWEFSILQVACTFLLWCTWPQIKKKKINILCTLYQINSYLLMEAII